MDHESSHASPDPAPSEASGQAVLAEYVQGIREGMEAFERALRLWREGSEQSGALKAKATALLKKLSDVPLESANTRCEIDDERRSVEEEFYAVEKHVRQQLAAVLDAKGAICAMLDELLLHCDAKARGLLAIACHHLRVTQDMSAAEERVNALRTRLTQLLPMELASDPPVDTEGRAQDTAIKEQKAAPVRGTPLSPEPDDDSPFDASSSRASPSTPTRQPHVRDAREKQEIRVHIRWMIRRDMPEVLEIEQECFEFPWLDDDFIRCLRQRNCIGMVAEHEDRIVGFMLYELHKTRIHVLNFAVDPTFQRRGVGSQMVAKLINKLSAQRRTRILLEVRDTNLGAQIFFRENGFRAVSVLHNFYADTPEDAYLMQYHYRQNGGGGPGSGGFTPTNRITRLAG